MPSLAVLWLQHVGECVCLLLFVLWPLLISPPETLFVFSWLVFAPLTERGLILYFFLSIVA